MNSLSMRHHFRMLADVGRGEAVAIANVRDERDLQVVPAGQSAGKVVADERNAGPGGIAGLSDEQDAERIGHAGPARGRGGSWLYRRSCQPACPHAEREGYDLLLAVFQLLFQALDVSRSCSISLSTSRLGGITSSGSTFTLTSGSRAGASVGLCFPSDPSTWIANQ